MPSFLTYSILAILLLSISCHHADFPLTQEEKVFLKKLNQRYQDGVRMSHDYSAIVLKDTMNHKGNFYIEISGADCHRDQDSLEYESQKIVDELLPILTEKQFYEKITVSYYDTEHLTEKISRGTCSVSFEFPLKN
ncbi:MAG: hypothetical protein AB8F95_00650 [Bacteroidia bacterium]